MASNIEDLEAHIRKCGSFLLVSPTGHLWLYSATKKHARLMDLLKGRSDEMKRYLLTRAIRPER